MSLTTKSGITYAATTAKSDVLTPTAFSAADYTLTEDKGTSCVFINKKTPVDQSQSVKYALQPIKNVYLNTNIDPSYSLPTKKGFSLLVQNQDTIRVTNSENPSFRMDFPISTHLVIKAPASEFVSAELLETEVQAVVGYLTTPTSTGTVLADLIRGGLRDVLHA